MMERHDSRMFYKDKTIDELRTTYKDIEEELIYRRDKIFDASKEDLQKILEVIRQKGYKLQVIDYGNEEKKIEIHNVLQFDVYDPVIETSEI